MIIWLASYPRSGNTFIRVLLNHAFGVKTYSMYDDKYDIAADEATREIVGHQELPENFDCNEARKSNELYFLKTHAPYGKDYEKDKAIYVLRDGRDATVSYYHYFNDYSTERFSILEIINGYTLAGSWGDHYYSWLKERRNKVILLRFEEIIKSPESAIKKIAEFTSLKPSKSKVPEFADLHNINPKFFRSGKINSFSVSLTDYEQKYFWLVNAQAIRDTGYIDSIPEFNSEAERDELNFKHRELTQRRKLRDFEKQIEILNQQLEDKEQIIQSKNIQLQQEREEHQIKIEKYLEERKEIFQRRNQQIEKWEQRLENNNIKIKEKNQVIEEKDNQLRQKEQELKEREQIIEDKDLQLQQKYEVITSKDAQLQQKIEQIEENNRLLQNKDIELQQRDHEIWQIKNSYAFKLGRIITRPLSSLKINISDKKKQS